ncbi:hypothetical protein [Hymenobacter baengnokdamensis]|uniref:hypothetical protein n=1 Tax=Hymenobacter baengnokdamensis TaxID=2615203 RepID=UPI0012471948|nr:hypothetical protein [Hymenobacter baengnokdamensis]
MKFFAWFAVVTILFVLIARFKPQSPAEPIIPTEAKEAQGQPGTDDNAPPARTEEQGKADAQKAGSTYVLPGVRPASAA